MLGSLVAWDIWQIEEYDVYAVSDCLLVFLKRVPSLQEPQLVSAAARHPGEPSDIPTALPL